MKTCNLKNVQKLSLNFTKRLFFEASFAHTRFFPHSPLFINDNSKTVIYHNLKDFGVNVKVEVRGGSKPKKVKFFLAHPVYKYNVATG